MSPADTIGMLAPMLLLLALVDDPTLHSELLAELAALLEDWEAEAEA